MSWEIDSIDKIKCPCGTGEIVREISSDDWNRFREHAYIQCTECNKKYHLERREFGYSVDASTAYYLAENDETLHKPRKLDFYAKTIEQ